MKQKWDQIYQDGAKYKPLNDLFIDLLLSFANKLRSQPITTAIDLGCGMGDTALKLRKRGIFVIGVDVSPVALEQARNELQSVGFDDVPLVEADLDEYDIEQKFDLIITKLTIAFLKDREQFFKKLNSASQAETILVVITPVLYTGVEYTATDKPGIAVDYTEILSLLNKYFTKVIEFHHDYFADHGDTITFVAQK